MDVFLHKETDPKIRQAFETLSVALFKIRYMIGFRVLDEAELNVYFEDLVKPAVDPEVIKKYCK